MGCCASTVDPKKEANNKKLPLKNNSSMLDKDNSIIRANQYKENQQIQADTYQTIQIKDTDLSRLSGFQEYKVNFKAKFLTSMNQAEFEEYFLESLISENTDTSLTTLMYNFDHVNEEYLFGIRTIPDVVKKDTIKIQDVSLINLSNYQSQSLYLQLQTKSKTFILNTQMWNPILIMISKNQLLPLQVLLFTRTSNFLHLQSLFQKPYLKQNQVNVAWSVQKKVKRQIFALKLAVYNKNLNMVQFLINGEPAILKEKQNKQYLEKINEQDLQQIQDQISQVWNVGHILHVIRQIIKLNWVDGLRLLFSLRRVKQLINSVNDANNFLSLLNQFIQLFFSDFQKNANTRYFPTSIEMKTEFLECLNQDPYKIFKIMINLYLRNLKDFQIRTMSLDETLQITSSLDEEFFPFFLNEISYIFKIFDPKNIYKNDVLTALQKLCKNENKMKQDMMQLQFNIEDLIQRSKSIKGTKEELKKIEMILDDLDALNPFQYKDFNYLFDEFEVEEDQKFKNIVTQLLSSGINEIIGHLYSSSSDCNIKSMLISDQTIPFSQTFFRMTKTDFRNTLMINLRPTVVNQNLKPDEQYLYESINKYEIKETANFNKIDVSFFMILLKKQGIEKFNFAMQHIIDQLDLNAILDLIMIVGQDEDLGAQVQLLLIETILQNPKTICLFNNSLELDKLSFVERFVNLLDDQEYFDSSYLNKQDEKKLKKIQQDCFKNYQQILQKDVGIIDMYKKQTEQWIASITQNGKQQNNLNQKISYTTDIYRKYHWIGDDQEEQNQIPQNEQFNNPLKLNLKKNIFQQQEKINEQQINAPIQIQDEFDEDHFDFQDGNLVEEEDQINEVQFRNTKQNFDIKENSQIIKNSTIKQIQMFLQEGEENQKNSAKLKTQNSQRSLKMQQYIENGEIQGSPSPQKLDPKVNQIQLDMFKLTQMQNEIQDQNQGQIASIRDTRQTVKSIFLLENVKSEARLTDIKLMFQELSMITIKSDISFAFSETIQAMRDSQIPFNEVYEALETFQLNPFEHVQVLVDECKVFSLEDILQQRKTVQSDFNNLNDFLYPDKQLWSLFMFAVFYDQTDIVEKLLLSSEFEKMFNSQIILRPGSSNQDLHVLKKQNFNLNSLINQFQDPENDQKYEANQLAICLTIQNRNIDIFELILSKFEQSLDCEDMCEIASLLLLNNDQNQQYNDQKYWIKGIQQFLRNHSTKLIFIHSRPSNQYQFICNFLIDPILKKLQYGKDSQISQVLKCIINELQYWPYHSIAVMKFPLFFHQQNILDDTLRKISNNDIIIFTQTSLNIVEEFKDALRFFESTTNEKNEILRGLVKKVKDTFDQQELLEPNDPQMFIEFIKKGETMKFINHYKKLQEQISDDKQISIYQKEYNQETYRNLEKIQLYRYVNYQLKNLQEQKIDILYLPQDEIIQSILYDFEEEQNQIINNTFGSVLNTEEKQIKILHSIQSKVLKTQSWNPLIFAIFFGQLNIVNFIFQQVEFQNVNNIQNCHQHLKYLLCDPFQIDQRQKQENGQQSLREKNEDLQENLDDFTQERASLMPLLLTLMTYQPDMFTLIWNHPQMWNKHIYLILMSNFVYETQHPDLIRAFLSSQKTKSLFNSISLLEKQKFVKFTIHSLEQMIVDDNQSQNPHNLDLQMIEKNKIELESILNKETLSQPPFLIVNLPENLIPLRYNSTKENLIMIMNEYKKCSESMEILELTLKNLQGDSPQYQGYSLKWNLINNNQVWAKKLWVLLQEIKHEDSHIYEEFQCLKILDEQILSSFFNDLDN